MRYWDASAILPILVSQAHSDELRQLLKQDKAISTSWISKVELASAVCRLGREGGISDEELDVLIRRVELFSQSCLIVHPSERVLGRAVRVLRSHSLKSSDSIQLASALVVSKEETSSFEFVTLDKQLANAARKEGFIIRGEE